MTTFLDGPAIGATLQLRRAPMLLRVVMARDGTIDALDQIEDVPNPDEEIFAYIITAKPTWMHVRASKGAGGMFYSGIYKLLDPQPTYNQMRDRKDWQRWVEAYVLLNPNTVKEIMSK